MSEPRDQSSSLDVLVAEINTYLAFSEVKATARNAPDTYVDSTLLRLEKRPEFENVPNPLWPRYDELLLDHVQQQSGGALEEIDADTPGEDVERLLDHYALDPERIDAIRAALVQFHDFDDEDRRFLAEKAGDPVSLDAAAHDRRRASHAALVRLAETINEEFQAHQLELHTVVSAGLPDDRWNGVAVLRVGYKPHKPGQEIHDQDEMDRDIRLLDVLAEQTQAFAFADDVADDAALPFAAPEGIVLLCDTSSEFAIYDALLLALASGY